MSSSSQDVGNAGPAFEVECDGKTYHASLLDDVRKTTFEKWLFQRHRQMELQTKEDTPEGLEIYQERLNQLNDQFLEGDFALLSERGMKAIKKPYGVLRLVAIIFGTDEINAIRLLAKKGEEVLSLIKLIFKESFPLPDSPAANGDGQGDADPNAKVPTAGEQLASLIGGK